MKRHWTPPTESWEVPATPVVPLEQVEDRVLLHLARTWGRLGRVAMCKFVSVLPEIHRRGLYRKAGFGSIYELAAKMGSLSREVVDAILRLHGYIGRYDCLWGLLSEGIVGWSKLSKVEDLVTPETAGWFARFVQEAPKSAVERIAARARVRLRQLSGDPTRAVSANAREAHLTTALLEEARLDTPACEDRAASKAELAPEDLAGRPSAGSAEAVSERVGASHVASTNRPAVAGASAVRESENQAGTQARLLPDGATAPHPPVVPGFVAPEGPVGDSANSSPIGLDQPVPSAAEGTPSTNGTDLGAGFQPHGPKRTSLELSPFCRELALRLQAEYHLRGVSVSLGELVELAFRFVWASGRFPLPDNAPAAVDPSAEITAPVPARPSRTDTGQTASIAPGSTGVANVVGDSGRFESDSAQVAQDAGHVEGDCESAGTKPVLVAAEQPERVSSDVEGGSGAGPRSLPLSQHKILAVVISVAETGQTWMRTLAGIIPVRLADLSGLAPVVEIVSLAEVSRRLEIKAAESRGKGILVDTRLFVAATSGLHCQARDCDQPAAHVHHGKPRAEGLDHGPANTYGICERCHAARHGRLVLNPDTHPGDWIIVEASQQPEPNRVDRACQALRQQALAAGFRVA